MQRRRNHWLVTTPGRLMTIAVVLGAAIAAGFAQTQFTLLEYTSQWSYLQGYVTPSNWFARFYDDSAWPQGRGTFAVPTNENVNPAAPVNTVLSSNVGGGLIMTYYFRSSFVFDADPSNVVITAFAAIDDGAVIYLNGEEVRRIGMPATGPVTYSTLANRGGEVSDRALDTFTLSPSNLVQGVNVLAVELHHASTIASDDAVFGMTIVAQQFEPVSIVLQPADQTVEVGRSAGFSVQATGSGLQYQWYTNNVAVLGARSSSHLTPASTLAMNGRIHHVVVSNLITVVTSAPARLTVVPDTFGPRVNFAVVSGANRIDVRFDEALLLSSATNLTNYSLYLLGMTNNIRLTNAQWGTTMVRVTADQNLAETNSYVVCFANIADVKTNVISPNPQCIAVGFPTTNTLISPAEVWHYNENETNSPPSAWVTLNYDDDPESPPYHWVAGYAGFRYTLDSVPPCSLIYPLRTWLSLGPRTYYFRKRFAIVEDFPSDAIVTLRYLVDDGAVFYLNGTEIHRSAMPAGPIGYSTPATYIARPSCISLNLPVQDLLVLGENIFAVEVHQAVESSPTETDVVFEADLTVAFRRTPLIPALQVIRVPGAIILRWEQSGWSLERAAAPAGPWIKVPTAGNEALFSLKVPSERMFFRLINP